MSAVVPLAPIDEAFGRMLARHAQRATNNTVHARIAARTGELLSAWRADGNSCLELNEELLHLVVTTDQASLCATVAEWRRALLDSGVCVDSAEASDAPLALDGHRLYLRRYLRAEQRLAASIRERVSQIHVSTMPSETAKLFRALFPARSAEPDWQAVAAVAALRSSLTFITGGPGTGKTTVAAGILALLLQEQPTARIALAAPTGRAAARLAEAITRAATTTGGLPADIAALLPTKGVTLHRLLGLRPWDDRFTYGPSNPLAHDVIVVDEASMVDVLMMDALFAAARPDARVIVLGDPDQLASVETGFVMGDITRAADAYGVDHGAALAAVYQRLSGTALPVNSSATALRDSVVRLRHSYRFASQAGIGQLAERIQRQDADGALAVLRDGASTDVSLQTAVPTTAALLQPIEPYITRYLDAATPSDTLAALSQFRVLCALREGDAGVSGLNAAIERWLQSRGADVRGWYDHRPVLITSNDQSTGLFNGDVGVTLVADGRATVWFAAPDGPVGFAPSRLSAHETAWAMTVHKAQGSEFEHVLFVCPDADHHLMNRELLYTAATRAKQSLTIVGDNDTIRAAIGRTVSRSSGLTERLSGQH